MMETKNSVETLPKIYNYKERMNESRVIINDYNK